MIIYSVLLFETKQESSVKIGNKIFGSSGFIVQTQNVKAVKLWKRRINFCHGFYVKTKKDSLMKNSVGIRNCQSFCNPKKLNITKTNST